MIRVAGRIDIGQVAPPEEKPAQVEQEPAADGDVSCIWNVTLYGEWHATWDNESDAIEHAKRINDALEWSGGE